MTSQQQPISLQISAARASAGHSQIAAADQLGISPAYLSRLECGRQDPSVALLQRIAELYSCEVIVAPFFALESLP